MTPEVLNAVRLKLLKLHKALLDMERLQYEQAHGRVEPTELLRLALNHEQFAWLRTISEMIVWIDEILDPREQTAADEAQQVMDQVRKLLTPNDISETFGRNYQAAMQKDPEVIMAHMELKKIL